MLAELIASITAAVAADADVAVVAADVDVADAVVVVLTVTLFQCLKR